MKIIAWWSGGITSAVACKKAIEIYDDVRVIFIDTRNEHEDTYRFKKDCEDWYGKEIESITNHDYESIEDVWIRHKSLNVAHGAVCSYKLKRVTREKWEKDNHFDHQVFGFEFDKKEFNRARSMALNHARAKPIFPLLMFGLDKKDCLKIVQDAGIEVPKPYRLGFGNNNCFKTGCVQGGIGYWKKMQKEFPDKFNAMAEIEHKITALKDKPVTMLKDQSKNSLGQVFLKKHPNYPNKSIDDMNGKPIEPLLDCNGFCGTNDLNGPSKTEMEIFWDDS